MFRPSGLPMFLVGLGLALAAVFLPNRFSDLLLTVGVIAILISIFRILTARGAVEVPGGRAPEDLPDTTSSSADNKAA